MSFAIQEKVYPDMMSITDPLYITLFVDVNTINVFRNPIYLEPLSSTGQSSGTIKKMNLS